MTMKDDLERIKEITSEYIIEDVITIIMEIKSIATQSLEDNRFTVEVKIPETDLQGDCSMNCPLLEQEDWLQEDWFQSECYNNLMIDGRPGPQCSRFICHSYPNCNICEDKGICNLPEKKEQKEDK